MKTFNMPAIEVQRFAIEDVITTSGGGCEYDCPADCPNDVCPFD